MRKWVGECAGERLGERWGYSWMLARMEGFFFDFVEGAEFSSVDRMMITIEYVHYSKNIENYIIFPIQQKSMQNLHHPSHFPHKPHIPSPQPTSITLATNTFTNVGQKQNLASSGNSRVQSRSRGSKKPVLLSGEQIVYVGDTAFIAARNRQDGEGVPKKVIGLANRPQSRSRNRSMRKSQQSAITCRVTQNPHPQPQKQARKIQILENRISQLHSQKQSLEIKLTQQNLTLAKEIQARDQRIRALEGQLALVCLQYELRDKQVRELAGRIGELEVEQRKFIQGEGESGGKDGVEESITTKNLINITLTQQNERLKEENKKLQLQIQSLRQKHPSTIKYLSQRQPPSLSPSPQAQNPLHQTLELSESQDILQIDSEQLQVDDIIVRITEITKQNEVLARELKEYRNQIQVRDAVDRETAKIIQRIRSVIGGKEQGERELKEIRAILDELY